MIKYSDFLLVLSFIILLFNGSALGFIFYQERLGPLFGIMLFCGTSLLGALLLSIAYEEHSTYYSRFFFISHLVVTCLPLYYFAIASLVAYS